MSSLARLGQSAVSPRATNQGIDTADGEVPMAANAPQQTVSFFDHLVGPGKESGTRCEAERRISIDRKSKVVLMENSASFDLSV